jgi:hypothetical protein
MRSLPTTRRCRHCGSPLLHFDGETYCPNCVSFRPATLHDQGDGGENYFLAPILDAYQERHDLGDVGLAAMLGCPPYALAMLRLCHRTGDARRTSEEDIATISDRFGVDAEALGRIVREVEG